MIIAYYKNGHSKWSTADKFEIELKQFREWIRNKEQLMRVASYNQRLNGDTWPKYPHLEVELIGWFKESRSQLKVVSHYMIQVKAYSLAKKQIYQMEYLDIKDVKFLQKWVDGFMIRHKLVNKRKTTIF